MGLDTIIFEVCKIIWDSGLRYYQGKKYATKEELENKLDSFNQDEFIEFLIEIGGLDALNQIIQERSVYCQICGENDISIDYSEVDQGPYFWCKLCDIEIDLEGHPV
tara:strand:+ start:1088 stop:1408 length:321 start_codon:yes stop_codon:yes gene_type:complete